MHSMTPFAEAGNWYKGNLHCHSTDSDGRFTPEQVIEFYKQCGYAFIALTDHQIFTDYHYLSDENFLVIPGIEWSVKQTRMPKSEHLCAFQMSNDSKPTHPGHKEIISKKRWEQAHDLQDAIDFLRQKGFAVVLNHPAWSRTDRETLLKTQNYFAIEIYSHDSEYFEHLGYSLDHWDALLRRGRNIWGIASDDAHHYHNEDSVDGGWVMVKAPELTLEAIMDALLAGRFYSSSGPELKEFRIESGEVFVECSPVEAIHFITYEKRGTSVRANGGELLSSATRKLHGEEIYIRVECEDRDGKIAWSNPIFHNIELVDKYINEDYLM